MKLSLRSHLGLSYLFRKVNGLGVVSIIQNSKIKLFLKGHVTDSEEKNHFTVVPGL